MAPSKVTFLSSLNAALHALCAADPSVYLLGEDITDPYGGAFKVTKGLSSAYPERVFSTPISEAGIVALSGGMALRGLRPIVEIMFGDFIALCADQILNHLSKYPFMYGQPIKVPVVIRTPVGGGRGYGPTHSQSLEKLFLGVPGLKVIAPSVFHVPGQCLIASTKLNTPVLFLEHKLSYPEELFTTESAPELTFERGEEEAFPTARLRNFSSGSAEVSFVCYGGSALLLRKVLTRLAQEEISAQAFVPSLLNSKNPSFIQECAATTTRGCILVEEGTEGFNWSSEIASRIQGSSTQKPIAITRICPTMPILPTCKSAESAILPSAEKLVHAAFKLIS